MSGVSVRRADAVPAALVEAVARLMPQLSSTAGPPTKEQLSEIVESPRSVLLLAETGSGQLVGMLTLVTYRIPTGLRAVIEDVVVDEDRRGLGVGSALVNEALAEAKARGARHVDLTSRPARVAANRLYMRLGFVKRDTNVYRHTLKDV
jgi:ribosomal protein S18 acetylase RimI-like enzyme